jgi:ABC-2 type transport system permease protein
MVREVMHMPVSQRSTSSSLGGLASDLGLYWRLIRMQLRAQAQYKLNLMIDIGTNLLMTGMEFLAVVIVFGPFPTLLGWRVGEVVLLYGMASVSFGLAELIGAGIDAFPEMIRRGEFDRVLLRPVGVLLQVVGSDFRLRRLGRISQGIVALGLALHLLPVFHWTPAKLALLPLGVVSGAAIFVAVLILGATLCFWTVETTELVNILTYGGREMLSWPMNIYNQAMQRIFLFVIPLAFGSYVPTCYLLDRPLPFGLPDAMAFASPLIALVFALVAWGIWNFGVRHYQSTGS